MASIEKEQQKYKERLKEVIRKAVISGLNGNIPLQKALYEDDRTNDPPQIIDVTDYDEIASCVNEVYGILKQSYSQIGGFLGAISARDLCTKITLLTLYRNSDHIYSAAIYNSLHGGYKLFGIGSDQSSIGKDGVHKIIQRDIKTYKGWYWCEASGAVEHLFDKYGGYAIPAEYASEILSNKPTHIVDEYHYQRMIGGSGMFTKIIYGFKNEDIYNKIKSIRNDSNAIKQAVNLTKKMNENLNDEGRRQQNNVALCCHIIGEISDDMGEWRVSDLTPEQYDAVASCVEFLRKYPNDNTAKQAIRQGEYMIQTYPIFELHQF